MKEQTPLERLIEKMKDSVETEIWVVNNPAGYDERDVARAKRDYNIVSKCIVFAESLLPEERKAIEEAYNLGSARTEYDDGFGMNLTISSEQYFTTKFKQ